MVFNDPDIRADEMPRGMEPKPGQGDLEEAFLGVLPDIDVETKMPKGIDDAAMLDEMEQQMCQTREVCERVGESTGALADVPDPDPEPIVELGGFEDNFDVGFQNFGEVNR